MKNFKHYLLELAVIIAGISISFIAEDWRNNRNIVSHNQQILERLIVSIDNDINDLKMNIKIHENASLYCSTIIHEIYNEDKELPLDSLSNIIGELTVMINFLPNEEEYNTLKNSGQIELIKDHSLVQSLYSKYMFHDAYRLVLQDVNNHVTNYVIPFLVDQKGLILDLNKTKPSQEKRIEFKEYPDLNKASFIFSKLNMWYFAQIRMAKELMLRTKKLKQKIQEALND